TTFEESQTLVQRASTRTRVRRLHSCFARLGGVGQNAEHHPRPISAEHRESEVRHLRLTMSLLRTIRVHEGRSREPDSQFDGIHTLFVRSAAVLGENLNSTTRGISAVSGQILRKL